MIIFQRVFKYRADTNMHKNIRGEITQTAIKRELSFLYATHRHDLFYITVNYHQNISNSFQVTERTQKCLRTDGRTQGSSLYPLNLSVGGYKLIESKTQIRTITRKPRKMQGNRMWLLGEVEATPLFFWKY